MKYNVLLYSKKTRLYNSNNILYDQEDFGISTTVLVLILLYIALYNGTTLSFGLALKI